MVVLGRKSVMGMMRRRGRRGKADVRFYSHLHKKWVAGSGDGHGRICVLRSDIGE